jgi:hypothetical protein
MTTQAEQIAERFGNDGLRFTNEADERLDDFCAALSMTGRKEWRDGHNTGDVYRYVFADGSAIVVAGDGWDIEGEEPFSWAGA